MAKKDAPIGTTLRKGNGNTRPNNLNMIDKTALSVDEIMSGNVYYQPPYSEAETNAASCSTLNDMIGKVAWELSSGDSVIGRDQRNVWYNWLNAAQERYNYMCAKSLTYDPVPPDIHPIKQDPVITPVDIIDHPNPLDTGMIEDPNYHPPALPVYEPVKDEPTVDNPDIIKTLFPPTTSPYPTGGGGGGAAAVSGGNKNALPTTNLKKWVIPVAAAAIAAGFLLFSPKMKMV